MLQLTAVVLSHTQTNTKKKKKKIFFHAALTGYIILHLLKKGNFLWQRRISNQGTAETAKKSQ